MTLPSACASWIEPWDWIEMPLSSVTAAPSSDSSFQT
jgi:hypothetical protein